MRHATRSVYRISNASIVTASLTRPDPRRKTFFTGLLAPSILTDAKHQLTLATERLYASSWIESFVSMKKGAVMKTGIRIVVVIALIVGGFFVYKNRESANWNNKGLQSLENDDFTGAAQAFDKAIELNPSNPAILRNAIQAYEGTNDYAKTRNAYALLEKVAPLTEDERKKVGDLGETERLLAEAKKRVERMKSEGWQAEPGVTFEKLDTIARTLEDTGRWDQSIVILERALFLQPDNADVMARIEQHEAAFAKEKAAGTWTHDKWVTGQMQAPPAQKP
jgi:hypothetical protein